MLTLAEASDCGFTTYVKAVLYNHPLNSPAHRQGVGLGLSDSDAIDATRVTIAIPSLRSLRCCSE